MLPNHQMLTPEEVREFLRVSKSKIYEMIDSGALPSLKIGRQIRIPRHEFLTWYQQNLKDFSSQ